MTTKIPKDGKNLTLVEAVEAYLVKRSKKANRADSAPYPDRWLLRDGSKRQPSLLQWAEKNGFTKLEDITPNWRTSMAVDSVGFAGTGKGSGSMGKYLLGNVASLVHSNKQQAGRGNVGKTAMEGLPILNIAASTAQQLARAVKVFDEMCHKEMLSLHEIDHGPVRRELDERFAREVLGLPESILQPGGALDVPRMKLAQEPSIRGNK